MYHKFPKSINPYKEIKKCHTCMLLVLVITLLAGLSSCKRRTPKRQTVVRPVKVLVLRNSKPLRSLQLTGSVKAWREENLAFEISGRVKSVANEETPVKVYAHHNANKTISVIGEIVAELDSSRYEADVAAAEAQLASAQAQVEALQQEIARILPQDIKRAEARIAAMGVTLQRILPQELKKAQAELERAKRDLDRARRLYQQATESQRELDQAQAQHDAAQATYKKIAANIPYQEREREAARADLAKAKALITIKQAQLKALKGKVKTARAQLAIAQRNLKECKLRAPFSGIISARRVSRGAVVGPSQPVVTVTIMDPILIEVAVSAQLARTIHTGDPIVAFPTTISRPITGWVQQKAIKADPQTRTYSITCMVRNRHVTPGGGTTRQGYYITKDNAAVVWRVHAGIEDSPLMVWAEAVHRDAQSHYVWAIDNFKLGHNKVNFQKVMLKKIRLELGEGFNTFGIRHFHEVAKHDGLEADMLTLQKNFANFERGVTLTYIPSEWMIHPEDLIPLSFDLGSYPQGIYVPIAAILKNREGHYIFINENQKAKKVQIEVGETFRDTRRIKAGEDLIGKQLIVFGAHYVRTGDRITASPIKIN